MKKKILFVCKGNICRSPAAEVIFKQVYAKEYPHVSVTSAATTTHCLGKKIHPKMVKALKKQWINANPHRPVVHMDQIAGLRDYQVVDLHELGISDPYLTGDFDDTVFELLVFMKEFVKGL